MQAILRLCSSLGFVAALGCTPLVPNSTPPESGPDPSASSEAGLINGIVKDSNTGEAVANALIMLQCTCLETSLERFTNDRGIYSFAELPPGRYTVQVFSGDSHLAK